MSTYAHQITEYCTGSEYITYDNIVTCLQQSASYNNTYVYTQYNDDFCDPEILGGDDPIKMVRKWIKAVQKS